MDSVSGDTETCILPKMLNYDSAFPIVPCEIILFSVVSFKLKHIIFINIQERAWITSTAAAED
jgi:hypothetical protein